MRAPPGVEPAATLVKSRCSAAPQSLSWSPCRCLPWRECLGAARLRWDDELRGRGVHCRRPLCTLRARYGRSPTGYDDHEAGPGRGDYPAHCSVLLPGSDLVTQITPDAESRTLAPDGITYEWTVEAGVGRTAISFAYKPNSSGLLSPELGRPWVNIRWATSRSGSSCSPETGSVRVVVGEFDGNGDPRRRDLCGALPGVASHHLAASDGAPRVTFGDI